MNHQLTSAAVFTIILFYHNYSTMFRSNCVRMMYYKQAHPINAPSTHNNVHIIYTVCLTGVQYLCLLLLRYLPFKLRSVHVQKMYNAVYGIILCDVTRSVSSKLILSSRFIFLTLITLYFHMFLFIHTCTLKFAVIEFVVRKVYGLECLDSKF